MAKLRADYVKTREMIRGMPLGFDYYLKRLNRLIFPKAGGIERLVYAVTYRCNSRCIMCNIWKDNLAPRPELTLEDLTAALTNQAMFQNISEIGLTGGEPFLRDDLARIGRFFLDQFPKARLSINTNGLLREKIIGITESLIKNLHKDEHNRIRISFSIDGIDEIHDSIRGIPNNYIKVTDLIKMMTREITGIEYGVTFTILPENFHQIWDVFLLSKQLNVGFSFSMAQTSGTFYQNINIPFSYKPSMLKAIESQIHKIQQDSHNFRNYYYSKMVEYQRNPSQYFTCYAGDKSFFLDPYGDIYPCILYDKPFGNLKDQNLQEVLNSNQAKKIRDSIREKRCHCWGCESEVSFRRSWKIPFWKALSYFSRSSNLLS
ncbi:radical SAM protein [Deltaproteobacteria bacterium]|nr:radical SAM protein [Deltaproteobacteria bacterium]